MLDSVLGNTRFHALARNHLLSTPFSRAVRNNTRISLPSKTSPSRQSLILLILMSISLSQSSKHSQSAEKRPQHCVDVSALAYVGTWFREEEVLAISAAMEPHGGKHLSRLEYSSHISRHCQHLSRSGEFNLFK
jgi:hypothetical protein